jgi:hypothetical protein
MRLTDLDPCWLMYEGRRVGFIFRSPTNREWWQTCFVEKFNLFNSGNGPWDPENGTTRDSQCAIIRASAPEVDVNWQGCDKNCEWTIAGGIESATFETMTVTPSLDGSKGGLWHGFITNGEIR